VSAPVLTGDPRSDRALVALARLLAEIAVNARAGDDRPAQQPIERPRRAAALSQGEQSPK
jgi:hypothetical protein